jgi:hypothetical protein
MRPMRLLEPRPRGVLAGEQVIEGAEGHR